MVLCLLVVYWHFNSDLSDLPLLHFWAVSLPQNCLLSLTPFWFWCSLFVFVNSTTFFSYVIQYTRDILQHAPCYLFCPQLLLSACLVLFLRWFYHSPFVSSPRPFYYGCLFPLVYSFFDCLNSWPPQTQNFTIFVKALVYCVTGHKHIVSLISQMLINMKVMVIQQLSSWIFTAFIVTQSLDESHQNSIWIE